MLLETILAALTPIAVEGVRGAIGKWMGGVKATTVEDQIKLDQAEIAKLEAVAKLDSPGGTPSQWVIDLRASSRYIFGGLIIIVALIYPFLSGANPEIAKALFEAANIVFGFLFGSRVVAGWRK